MDICQAMLGNVSISLSEVSAITPETNCDIRCSQAIEVIPMLLNAIILLLLEKSGEIVLELLLERLWKWVLSDRNLKHLLNSLKLQILMLYLDWVLLKSPIKSLPDQPEEENLS